VLNDDIILGFVIAAAAADLKMIDNEMQAILAELLMSSSQPAVQPEPARLSFPISTEDTVARDLVSSLQPQIVPQQQLIQTPGVLLSIPLISPIECCRQQSCC